MQEFDLSFSLPGAGKPWSSSPYDLMFSSHGLETTRSVLDTVLENVSGSVHTYSLGDAKESLRRAEKQLNQALIVKKGETRTGWHRKTNKKLN